MKLAVCTVHTGYVKGMYGDVPVYPHLGYRERSPRNYCLAPGVGSRSLTPSGGGDLGTADEGLRTRAMQGSH